MPGGRRIKFWIAIDAAILLNGMQNCCQVLKEKLMDAAVTTLENGIRVVTVPMPHAYSAAIGVLVGVGSRYETMPQAGISHFIEHLLFKGTATLSARTISRAIEGHGALCEAFTQEEETCYFVQVPAVRMGPVFRVITEMYLHPRFARRDIERERGVVVDEIMMYRDQPDQMVEETVSGQLFPRHALGRTPAGSPHTLSHIRREDLFSFKKVHYVPANTVFAFAGRIAPAACIEKARRRTSALKPQPAPRSRNFGGRTAPRPAVLCIEKSAVQSHLALGFRTFGRHDSRRHTLQLLNIVLGESMNSRLFQKIREQLGLVYAISSDICFFRETGELVISAGTEPSRAARVLQLVVREINRLRQRPVSRTELRQARDYAAGRILLTLESASGRMMWAGGSVLHLGRLVSPSAVLERLRAVTATDMQRLAGLLLHKNNAAASLVGPAASTQQKVFTRILGELT